jgi:hypothetical protein
VRVRAAQTREETGKAKWDCLYLIDLAKIVMTKPNWGKVFQPIFRRDKKVVEKKLDKLNNVRNNVSHYHPANGQTYEEEAKFLMETRRWLKGRLARAQDLWDKENEGTRV